jgi:nitronate monooxygenase
MKLGELRHPIVQAPMAGGPSTPGLVIAVCEAGGLGFLAAGYISAEAMKADISAVRVATTAPFGVNLFVPADLSFPVDEQALEQYVDRLRPEAERYGTQVGAPRRDDDDWAAKLAALAADPAGIAAAGWTPMSPRA